MPSSSMLHALISGVRQGFDAVDSDNFYRFIETAEICISGLGLRVPISAVKQISYVFC
jgi:broad specificity phosphatase PhoE